MPKNKSEKQRELIFTIEYRVDIGSDMAIPLEENLEKLRETGSADVIDVRIEYRTTKGKL